MKKNILLFCLVLVFISCSDDNNEIDIIIGQWKTLKIYENNNEVEIDPCHKNFVTVFKDNYKSDGFTIPNSIQLPSCPLSVTVIYSWRNLGENKYEFKEDGTFNRKIIYTFYKKGKNLVQELNNRKIIYEPYRKSVQ